MAGDIAEEHADAMWDNYGTDYEQEDYDTGPKYFPCKHCGASVRWGKDGRRWIVVTDRGVFHGTQCADRTAKPEEFDVLR